MKINSEKLDHELTAAGIEFSGCNSNGVVWDKDGITEIQGRRSIKAVLAAHDPTPEIKITTAEIAEALLQASEGKPEKLEAIKAKRSK